MKIIKKIFFISIILINTFYFSKSIFCGGDYQIFINRKNHVLYVIGNDRKIVFEAPCGIGRGGLKKKQSMTDSVTPTGEFTVDIILHKESNMNVISESDKKQFSNSKKFSKYVADISGLKHLFDNMNNIDFDHDGRPDAAYGTAYIGLNSNDVITGPKMQMFGATPYWYSIAIHGTTTPANIGRSNSGGCVHISEDILDKLIKGSFVKIGTRVKIADEEPSKN